MLPAVLYKHRGIWLCIGVRVDGGRQRQSATGGKKGGHKFSKKHNSSDIKKSRSSPSHLATATEDDRDPDSYQTISIQVYIGYNFVLSLIRLDKFSY